MKDMVDFFTPVLMPRSAFEQLIARVDEAVERYDVALCLHEDYPFRSLYSISPTAIDYSEINIDDDPDEIVNNLDQIIYFAFGASSNSTVSSWAKRYDESLQDEAVNRVQYLRENMPNLAKLWTAKNDSITRPLIEFSYDASDMNSENRRANLYIAAARIDSSDGLPDKSDIERIRVQLWPADVRFLMAELSHLWHAHLSDGGDQEEENGDER